MLLNCHTYYSLNYGTLSVTQLLEEVKTKGYTSFVLSDINNTSACIEVSRRCDPENEFKEYDLKPIMGIDFRNGIKPCYVGIARNPAGFKELNDHLSHHLHNNLQFNSTAPENFNEVYVIYPLSAYKGWPLRENEFIGVSVNDLKYLHLHPAGKQLNKMVILQTVSFAHKKHFNAHRLLRAIDQNVILSKLPASEQTQADEIMPDRRELYKEFQFWSRIIENTEYILNDCSMNFSFNKFANKNPKSYTKSILENSDDNDLELLRTECEKNLFYRYGEGNKEVRLRLEKELDVIAKMKFASYFLINWDIIKHAQDMKYYYVGRGSGANSMAAYLLRITDVDPIKLDLYFERFINTSRTNPPDFDIDFSWTDRDEMTDYIFKRFGKGGKAALLGAYNTYQRDAVIRQLGKVFGLPPGDIDRLQATEHYDQADDLGKLVLNYSHLIHEFPSHLSIHSSGILISEEPITAYCGTFMPPKGFPTTQFSMIEAEDIGLYKFDILSQRGLGKIKDTLEIVEKNHNVKIDIHDVERFYVDDTVKSLLKVGKTIGCFYIESPAMRMLLAKLTADDYLRLVAASSIIRPGVAKSGMMREYILRFRDENRREEARKALPELYAIMEETYGVMVYQEDVIKVAHQFAGLSLTEADYLRRGMSWKFKQRSEFFKVEQNFINSCIAKGCSMEATKEIWRQIETFANFAFSKGHSASYAVESYQALFLKAYYPLEYMTATLNNGGGFYRMELYVHEARMLGADIQPPCVNKSETACIIEKNTIYLGLGFIGNLEKPFVAEILKERAKHGDFRSLHDFIKRLQPSIEQMRLLIRVGALRFTEKNKKELLWEAHSYISPVKKEKIIQELFDVEPRTYALPQLTDIWYDNAFDELELLGFSLESPFRLLKDKIEFKMSAQKLKNHIGKNVEIVGYMIAVKNTSTTKGDLMHFGTFIDSAGDWIDTVHFPPSAKAFPFRGPGCYKLYGKVTEEFDFITLEVDKMERLAMLDRDSSTRLKPGRRHFH
jgi:DNA polymerase III subunit alpha